MGLGADKNKSAAKLQKGENRGKDGARKTNNRGIGEEIKSVRKSSD